MIVLDGSQGEGGGQILRTSFALAAITQTPLRVENVRAGRAKPGLMRQHLRAVEAAALACGGELVGAELGSTDVAFTPGVIRAGALAIDIGSAGSTTLVLQTILPILLHAPGPSTVRISGGTHNPSAPPAPYLEAVYAPLVAAMGGGLTVRTERPGFMPAGGGVLVAEITPGRLVPLERLTRGGDVVITCEAIVSGIRASIALRELEVLGRAFNLPPSARRVTVVEDPRGPGNAVWARLDFPNGCELVSQIGEKSLRAEAVAQRVVKQVRALLAADVPVGPHTADQLLLLCAIAGGGRYRTSAPTLHTRTNADVIGRFLAVDVRFVDDGASWVVEIDARAAS